MRGAEASPIAKPPGRLRDWLYTIGPGAIIASLTIGTGELIFSSRGGALFGYRVLYVATAACLLKWALVFGAARHLVLTGRHPFERWAELPGPRGWLPWAFFLPGLLAFPVWIAFHSGVLGDLLALLTETRELSGARYAWGLLALAGAVLLVVTGSYRRLERIQITIVSLLLLAVTASLVLLGPDWLDLLRGLVVPSRLDYPDWLAAEPRYAAIAKHPPWAEATLYLGVIGGAGYDYLAYAAFLREKRWGLAAVREAEENVLEAAAADRSHPLRRWLHAPLIDATLSFAAVLLFTAVFVACGALVLGPRRAVPGEENFLGLQSAFVRELHPVLEPLYFAGAFLAMAGTLYGTIEVAPAVLGELLRMGRKTTPPPSLRIRRLAVAWCAGGAALILAVLFLRREEEREVRETLISLLRPANLFTGVFSCGVIALLNPWMDRRFLPRKLRMPFPLVLLNLAAAAVFLSLGLEGYWKAASPAGPLVLAATAGLGAGVAWSVNRLEKARH